MRQFFLKNIVSAILFSAAMLVITPSLAYSQSIDAKVNEWISMMAKKAGAEEYEKARKIVRGDLNGDGKQDIAVLYTLEGFGGGNGYGQYLMVFVGTGKTIRYVDDEPVGGKNNRAIDLVSITNGKISLRTTKYAKNDPSCCPTIKGRTAFVLRGGKLKEI